MLGIVAPVAPAAGQTVFDCVDVFLLFGRGSGQTLGSSEETDRFFEEVEARLSEVPAGGNDGGVDGYSIETRELGEGYEGFSYPAVGGLRDLIEGEASWTGFLGGQYNESVEEGKNEAVAYLNARAVACPGEQWVLGGYSQGAQTMGEALFELSDAAIDNVAFVAQFGDPKLDTKDARISIPLLPDIVQACLGDTHPWRRGNAFCNSSGGILESRVPYVPDAFADKTGSWCDRFDGICTDQLAFAFGPQSAHSEYPDGEMPDAAREIAGRLAERLPNGENLVDIRFFQFGGRGIDLVFVIDTTGSMAGEIADVKTNSVAIANTILALDIFGAERRVALVQYRDQGDAFVSRLEVPLTSDGATFAAGVDGLVAAGGGDFPEAVLSGIWTGLNDLDWNDGASKAAIVIGDAPGRDPEPVTGLTNAQILQRALEIDPVNIYTINVGSASSTETFFRALSDGSDGEYIELEPGQTTTDAVLEVLQTIETDPIADLFGPLYAPIGQEIRFDASRSVDPDSELVSYEWDFDNDGTVDATTTVPTVTHTYPDTYDGLAVVTVRSADGGTANAVAEVIVSDDPFAALRPDPPTDVVADVTGEGQVTVSWTASPSSLDSYLILRSDGTQLAIVDPLATSVVIGDIPPGTTTSFLVQAQGERARSLPVESNVVEVGGTGPCFTLDPTIVGTDGPDVIDGTNGPDVILALGGNDVINGLNGNDVICGGAGDDTIFGNNGEDQLFGQSGADEVHGGNGKDLLDGGSEDDVLFGGNGKDHLVGGSGTDSADGGKGVDTCEEVEITSGC